MKTKMKKQLSGSIFCLSLHIKSNYFAMETLTLRFDPKSAFAAALAALLEGAEGVSVLEKRVAETESPYDPEFVAKIERSRKSTGKKIALEDLWK